ncbi:hypothetical protein [Paenibacillus sp. GXUN7292]|uniref:hypothetical protein n=1 Tax=Paenibacillus sp. GXUN7292 TaxID=3422499 RepID=UPI003D7CE780
MSRISRSFQRWCGITFRRAHYGGLAAGLCTTADLQRACALRRTCSGLVHYGRLAAGLCTTADLRRLHIRARLAAPKLDLSAIPFPSSLAGQSFRYCAQNRSFVAKK